MSNTHDFYWEIIKLKKSIQFLISLFLLVSSAFASTALPAWQAFQVHLEALDNKTVAVKFNIAPEYHLYKERIEFKNLSTGLFKLGTPILPEAKVVTTEHLGTFDLYEGATTILLPVVAIGDGKLRLQISYQGCKGFDLCYAMQQKIEDLDFNNLNSTRSSTVYTPPAITQNSSTEKVGFLQQLFSSETDSSAIVKSFTQSSVLVVLGFFVLGLLIAFTPCVFPLFPILIAVISGANVTTKRSFMLASSYVFGGALTYAGAGILAASLGYSLSAALQSTWMAVLLSLLFMIFALSLFGVFTIQLPLGLQNRLNNIINSKRGGSLLGAMIIGGVSNLILSPCVTAPLAGALIYISTTGDRILGGAALFALGIGSGLPLLIIAVLGKRFLPKNGNWMLGVKYFLGHLMVAIAIYMSVKFLSHDIVLGIIGSWLSFMLWQIISKLCLERYKMILATNIAKQITQVLIIGVGVMVMLLNPVVAKTNQFKTIITNNAELDIAIQQVKLSGKPILLDYYAKWCVGCMEMDLQTFSDPNVQKIMEQYTLIRADVTKNGREENLLEQRFNVIAPPSIVFLNSNGEVVPEYQITGFIGKVELANKLENLLTNMH